MLLHAQRKRKEPWHGMIQRECERLREWSHKHPINFDQWAVPIILCKRLTKREELSFLTVLALPKASSRGLALMIWSSRVPCREGREQCSPVGLQEFLPGEPRPSWAPDPGNPTHLHFARSRFLLLLLPSDGDCGKVLDDTLRVHSLSCPGFSAVK